MRFDARSKTLLAITKSKAKMFELGLPEKDHIDLEYSPSNLLVMAVGMLGDICRYELSDDDSEYAKVALEQSRTELRDAAKYFDALDETQLEAHYSYYLNLLAASAYYLANMPGSAVILINKAQKVRSTLTDNGLEVFLDWLLLNDYNEAIDVERGTSFRREVKRCGRRLKRFFNFQTERPDQVLIASAKLRAKVHAEGSDRELLLVDAISAIIKRRIENSSISMLPNASGLPLQEWMPALNKTTFVTEFWPAQRLLSEKGVFKGRSAVVQLPTSAGKTKSSEIIIRSAFLSGRADLAILVAPYRSLCREIKDAFSQAFADENIDVNQLNDSPHIDEWDEEILKLILEDAIAEECEAYKSVIVSMPEKLVYLLRHRPELKAQIGLLIFDEGHQFDTGARGVTYELLLANLKRSVSPDTQIVLISAVISNAESIGDWLYSGEGEVVNGSSCLATERSIAFSSWRAEKGQLHYISPAQPDKEEYFVPRVLETAEVPLKGRERNARYFPEKGKKTSVAAYLAFKLSELGPVAVFCGTKKTVTSICKLMIAAQDRLEQLANPVTTSDQQEIEKIYHLAVCHFGEAYVLSKAIKEGILPHSASVPNGIRVAVEYAMENSMARCVICTSTLAQGVNLPIKYLVISGVFQGKKRVSTRDFHNLIGRAGRAGKHTEGSIIFADTELYDQRKGRLRWQWDAMKQLLDPAQSEGCASSLKTLIDPFENDPFGIDPIKFAENPDKIRMQYLKAAERRQTEVADIEAMLVQMKTREGYIHSVESYLLSLPEIDDESFETGELIGVLEDTLAYNLCPKKEKKNLLFVFKVILEQVESVPVKKRSGFGKALLGVQPLERIEEWLIENSERLAASEGTEALLESLWPLLIEIVDSPLISKIQPADAVLKTAKRWCSGASYSELRSLSILEGVKYKTEARSVDLSFDHIIALCDNVLSYQMMLVVGAIADLMEVSTAKPESVELIRHFQATMKLGFESKLEHWLYSKGLIDREICKELRATLEGRGVDAEEFPYDLLKTESALILSTIEKYPTYFSEQLF